MIYHTSHVESGTNLRYLPYHFVFILWFVLKLVSNQGKIYMIVDDIGPITLIGSGDADLATIAVARRLAPMVVAADGGAVAALAAGAVPRAVIGDMDSLPDATRALLDPATVHVVTEQDSTDFEKCLQRLRTPLILAVGFTGDRMDHQLAALTTLVRYPAQRCIVLAPGQIAFLCPPTLTLDLIPDTLVSLYPMGAVTGTSQGLEWPIAGLRFAPDGRVGTSNRAIGPVALTFDAARMLVILPRQTLTLVAAALLAAPDHWPAAPVSDAPPVPWPVPAR